MNGRIRVVLSTWQGERFVDELVESILRDLPPDGELRVRDDASTDSTPARITSWAARDPRVQIVQNGPRIGAVRSFGRLLQDLSPKSDDLVFLADQDDVWLPGKVQGCALALHHAVLAVHDARRIDADGRDLGDTLFERRGWGGGVGANLVRNRFTGCCMAFRASLLRWVLPLPHNVPMHDWWIGLRALRSGTVAWIPEPLLLYRVHAHNATPTGGGKPHVSLGRRIVWRLRLVIELLRRERRGNVVSLRVPDLAGR